MNYLNLVPSYAELLKYKEQKLCSISINGELSTFKYKPIVLFNNLWAKYPLLMECRGHTYNNETGELVVLPFRKSFGYLENDTWARVPLETTVLLYKKYNGFMAACTLYEGDLLVSTTGSTRSAYAELAKEQIKQYCDGQLMYYNRTYLFEIVHKSDPHIVNEKTGVYPLGYRDLITGEFFPCGEAIECTLAEALELQKVDKGEGYMVYQKDVPAGGLFPCKLKSWHYRDKKKIMRLSDSKVKSFYLDSMQRKNFYSNLSEEFKEPFMYLFSHYSMQDVIDMSDQERRIILEEVLK